jgi:hypothetical protein
MARIGPAIPLNDLTLYLDASINTSYPGYGSIWYDLSGKGNNFTLTNTPTHDGSSFNFNGTNQFATCVNNSCGNLGSGSATIETLVYLGTPTIYDTILAKRGKQTQPGGAGSPGWTSILSPSNGTVSFYAQDTNPGGVNGEGVKVDSLTNITGSIKHIVFSLERNGFEMTGSLWINNILNNTDTWLNDGNNLVDYLFKDGVPQERALKLMSTYGESSFTTGSLYFVRLWNRALTPSEIGTNWGIARNKYGI